MTFLEIVIAATCVLCIVSPPATRRGGMKPVLWVTSPPALDAPGGMLVFLTYFLRADASIDNSLVDSTSVCPFGVFDGLGGM